MHKRKTILSVALCLSMGFSMVAYAGQWKQDETGFWYQNDDGSFPVSQWQWIDSSQNGAAKCYYFNSQGYLETSTTVDGFTVNQNGEWTADGQVQQKTIAISTQQPWQGQSFMIGNRLYAGTMDMNSGECSIVSYSPDRTDRKLIYRESFPTMFYDQLVYNSSLYIVANRDGNYRLLKITPDGTATTVFQPDDSIFELGRIGDKICMRMYTNDSERYWVFITESDYTPRALSAEEVEQAKKIADEVSPFIKDHYQAENFSITVEETPVKISGGLYGGITYSFYVTRKDGVRTFLGQDGNAFVHNGTVFYFDKLSTLYRLNAEGAPEVFQSALPKPTYTYIDGDHLILQIEPYEYMAVKLV